MEDGATNLNNGIISDKSESTNGVISTETPVAGI